MLRDDDLLAKLSKDTTLYLLSFLDKRDVCQVSATCKNLNNFTDTNAWTYLLERDFATSIIPKEFSNAKAYYMALDQEVNRFLRQLIINSCIYLETGDLRYYTSYLDISVNNFPNVTQTEIEHLNKLARLWLHNILFKPDILSYSNLKYLMEIFRNKCEHRNRRNEIHCRVDKWDIFNTDFSDCPYPLYLTFNDNKKWLANADFFLFSLTYLPALGCRYLLGLLLDKHPDLLHITTNGRYGYSFITDSIQYFQVDIIADLLIRMKQSGSSFCGNARREIYYSSDFLSFTPLLCAVQNAILLYLSEEPIIIDDKYFGQFKNLKLLRDNYKFDLKNYLVVDEIKSKMHLKWLADNREQFTRSVEIIIPLLLENGLSPDELSYFPDGDSAKTPLNLIQSAIYHNKIKKTGDNRIQQLYSLLLQYSNEYKDNNDSILNVKKVM